MRRSTSSARLVGAGLIALTTVACSGPAAVPASSALLPAPSQTAGGGSALLDARSAGALGSSTAGAAFDDSEARLAAQRGLHAFLDRIPEARRSSYGFAARDEIDRAQLGTPYRVWTADPPEGALRAVREWRFPVAVDGEYRALLTVGEANGALRAVDLGAAALARELHQRERDRAVPAQASRVLLRLYALRADFVAFPPPASRVEDAAFEALASARALPRSPAGAVGLSRLRPWLAERFDEARPR